MKRRTGFCLLVMVILCPAPLLATTPHTITVDGNLSEWDADEKVWNDSGSDCYWDFNELHGMYVTWDDNNLYIGAEFEIEEANSLSYYMDFAMGEGATDLGTVSWLKFFYTDGWLANFSVNCSGNATNGIYRIYENNSHDEWTGNPGIETAIDLDNGMYECALSWDRIYSPGSFPAGASMGIVCTLTGYRGYDGADAMPDQSVQPNGDGNYDTLDVLYNLNFDDNNDGTPESGWHPNTNSGAEGEPPNARARANPTSGPAPLEVQFEGIGNDPDGGSVTYHWEFGDGGSSDEQNPLHTYNNPGTYTAVLTVTDDEGVPASDSVTITVTSGNDPLLDLTLSKESPNCFRSGDNFVLACIIENPGDSLDVDLYCVLDVFGAYYFWPSWTQTLGGETITLTSGGRWSDTLLQFTWPSGAGSADNIAFYAAMMQVGTYNLVGTLDTAFFCFR